MWSSWKLVHMSIPQGVRVVVWASHRLVHHWEGTGEGKQGAVGRPGGAEHDRAAQPPLNLSIEHISTKRLERREFEAARPWPYRAKKSGRSGVSPPGQPNH